MLITLSLVLAVSAPQDDELAARARRLTEATPVTSFRLDDVGELVDIQPGGHLVAVMRWAGDARLLRLPDGAVRPFPGEATPTCVAFAPDGRTAWYGTAKGELWRAPLDGGQPRGPLDAAPGLRLQHLVVSPGGSRVAWYDRKSEQAGVFDAATSAPLARWTDVRSARFGNSTAPLMTWVDDDRLVLYRRGDGHRGASLWSLSGERSLLDFAPYVAGRTPGWSVRGERLVYGERLGSNTWKLRHVNLSTLATTTLDEDPRGGHFIDLWLSPTGRRVAEWDFEEESLRLYELGSDGPPRDLAKGSFTFLGFDRPLGDVDLVFLSGPKRRGVELWSSHGERLAELEVFHDERIEFVRLTDDDRYLVAAGWVSDDARSIQYFLRALELPAARNGPGDDR